MTIVTWSLTGHNDESPGKNVGPRQSQHFGLHWLKVRMCRQNPGGGRFYSMLNVMPRHWTEKCEATHALLQVWNSSRAGCPLRKEVVMTGTEPHCTVTFAPGRDITARPSNVYGLNII